MITESIRKALKRSFIPLLCLTFTLSGWSQEPFIVPRLAGKLTLNGIPDEEGWQSIPSLPMTVYLPAPGAEPTETSVIKIAFDNDYFYVSGILNFKNPSDLRAFGRKRDYSWPTTDWLGVFLDTFNDRENTLMFWTNPNGLRSDGTTQNDVADPERDFSFSWNTFWDVETNISENGWSAEMRIPFSSLRFLGQNNNTLMGLTLFRYDAAKSEFSSFPPILPDQAYGFLKASKTRTIMFEGIKPVKPFYITPYATTGLGQESELNEEGTGYEMTMKPEFDIGGDIKYSLTNNLTLDLTINTDFAQVEADDQKINLTRFSLYFPEKRVFFLEKSDVFDFSFLGGNNLFYSRRIGLYDGNPVRIYGGVRLTGRVGEWDLGVMDMQTAAFEENPGENFGVVRAKRKVFNQNSYLGSMITSRIGTDGTYNMAYGLDGQIRVTGDEYLTVRWAQTFEDDSTNNILDMAPARFLFNWERRRQTGFGYDLAYTWSGYQYNPGIGFELKDNYHGYRTIFQYGWLPGETAALRFHKISLINYTFWNTLTGLQETINGVIKWYFETKKGSSGNVAANWFLEDLADSLSLGNDQAYVPPGRYSFFYLSSMYSTSYSHSLYATFTAEAGAFFDGYKISISGQPGLTIGSGLEIGASYYLDYVRFPGRSVSFINHIAGIKGLLTMTTKTSLSAFVQYNTAIDKVITNIRFRYNPREGNDFYIVYDEGLNADQFRETPPLPLSSGRTILLKYTYTFIL